MAATCLFILACALGRPIPRASLAIGGIELGGAPVIRVGLDLLVSESAGRGDGFLNKSGVTHFETFTVLVQLSALRAHEPLRAALLDEQLARVCHPAAQL